MKNGNNSKNKKIIQQTIKNLTLLTLNIKTLSLYFKKFKTKHKKFLFKITQINTSKMKKSSFNNKYKN